MGIYKKRNPPSQSQSTGWILCLRPWGCRVWWYSFGSTTKKGTTSANETDTGSRGKGLLGGKRYQWSWAHNHMSRLLRASKDLFVPAGVCVEAPPWPEPSFPQEAVAGFLVGIHTKANVISPCELKRWNTNCIPLAHAAEHTGSTSERIDCPHHLCEGAGGRCQGDKSSGIDHGVCDSGLIAQPFNEEALQSIDTVFGCTLHECKKVPA